MTTFDDFSKAAIAHGYVPPVVPELKTITIGGAIVGIGIESSSHKFGLVHEMVEEMEVLLADGSIVSCSRKENSDLFFALPNSYGTLGYVIKVRVPLVKAAPYVLVRHEKFSDVTKYFLAINQYCDSGDQDFIDGSVFAPSDLYITRGWFVHNAPYTNSYTYMKMYFKSIEERTEDYLSVYDYLWRWDTDWFWCSKIFGVQNKVLRFFVPFLLNSKSYWKLMQLNTRFQLTARVKKVTGDTTKREAVVQDVEIPIENAGMFLEFFHKEIGILPVWVCPIKPVDKTTWTLYGMKQQLYINFGFWDVIPSTHAPGYFNKKIESKVEQLKGKKSLYSESYYSKETFWKLYNIKDYDTLKNKYDPTGKLSNLYDKCVQRY